MRYAEAVINGRNFRNLNTQTHYKFVNEDGELVEDKVLPEVKGFDAKELSVKREYLVTSQPHEIPKRVAIVNVLTPALKTVIAALQKSPRIHYIIVDRDTHEALLRADLCCNKIVLPAPYKIHLRLFYWPEIVQLSRSDISNQIAAAQPIKYDLPKLRL